MSLYHNQLPCEVIQKVLEYLPVKDRKSASLVCRMWNQEAFSARLQGSVQLRIPHLKPNNMDKWWSVLQNSVRSYRNLYVSFCTHGACAARQFAFVRAVLDKFGSKIETFIVRRSNSWIELQEHLARMPKLIVLLAYATKENYHIADQWMMLPNGVNGLHQFTTEKLHFDQLKILKLRAGYRYDDAVLENLFHQVPRLEELYMNFAISRSSLEIICRKCPLLKILDICAKNLVEKSFHCMDRLTNLQVLIAHRLRTGMLEGCKPVPNVREFHLVTETTSPVDAFVAQLKKVFPNLHCIKVYFRGCHVRIIDQILILAICQKFDHLKKLTVCGNFDHVTSRERDLPGNLGRVEDLTLRHESVFIDPPAFSNVKRLALEHFDPATLNFSRFAKIFPNLRQLDVRNCRQINQYMIMALRRMLPKCVVNYVPMK